MDISKELGHKFERKSYAVNELSDEHLIGQAVQGSKACFEQIVHRHSSNLLRFVRSNVSVAQDAEDIVPRYKNYGFDLVCHQVDLNTGLDSLETFIQGRNTQ